MFFLFVYDFRVSDLGFRGYGYRLCLKHGQKEWMTEVNVLGVVKHPNLVKLVGYCAEDGEGSGPILVYEFMPNGSVDDHLYTVSKPPLSWSMRLKVAQDAARGLAYLHEEMDFQVVLYAPLIHLINLCIKNVKS